MELSRWLPMLSAVAIVQPAQSNNHTYEYAVGGYPKWWSHDNNGGKILLTANTTTTVTVSFYQQSDQYTISAGQTKSVSLGQATTGTSKSGCIITSDHEIQLMFVHNFVSFFNIDWQDAYQVNEKERAGTTYYALSYPSATQCDASTHFLSIIPYADNTDVLIRMTGGSKTTIQLQKFDVHTILYSGSQGPSDILSGTKVTSSKYVMVISGNACLSGTMNSLNSESAVYTAMVPVVDYAYAFIAPVIDGQVQESYALKVISSEDGNSVRARDQTWTLHSGQHKTFDFPDANNISPITCSKPCDVKQLSYGGLKTGVFMMNVIPVSRFYQYAYFNAEYHINMKDIYMTVILHGSLPVNNVFLDGQSLVSSQWRTSGDFVFMSRIISKGFHRIHSLEQPMAVYVYSHGGSGGGSGGSGFAVRFGDVCLPIKWCGKFHCQGRLSICTECEDYAGPDIHKQAYWLHDNACSPRCNWLGHWCWPGTCDLNNEYLNSTCQCQEGFELTSSDEMTTKCKLVHEPKIETCRMGVEDDMGNVFNSTFVGNTTSCANTRDTFINILPAHLFFMFEFAFRLPEDPPAQADRHKYIHDFSFGIVGANVQLLLYGKHAGGTSTTLTDMGMPADAVCNFNNFTELTPVSALVSCKSTYDFDKTTAVTDGDKLCQNFSPVGSGYVRIVNMVNNDISEKHLYDKTRNPAEKCFRFDFTEPNHCKNDAAPCSLDPLNIGSRIQRHPNIIAIYQGYIDPDPNSAVTGPSGVHRYQLDVRHMQHDYGTKTLFVNKDIEETHHTEAGVEEMQFTLPDMDPVKPVMFALYLTTIDLAGNPRMARRFVLYDNISLIESDNRNPLRPISANPSERFLWQVSLNPIVVDWNEHFYNNHHKHSNLLWPIQPDNFISGIFEQEDGPLPVSGTENVHGITEFQYAFIKTSPTSNQTSEFKPILTVTDQQITLNELIIEDGDTVDVTIKAIDIMDNTLTESFRMHIDSTPPVVQNLGLTKDGYTVLYVHSSNDLVEMMFQFEAFDPHSSLRQVYWKLGTTPQGNDVGHGALPVEKRNSTSECPQETVCYCPIIGKCSNLNFTIDLNQIRAKGTDEGDHNRNYYFWVEAINEAGLSSIEEFTVLVDHSPPEVGVVIDGPEGSLDRDFQSDDLLQWHWRGFVDHESGISKYHFAVGEQCFSKEDLQYLDALSNNTSIHFYGDTTSNHAEYQLTDIGFYQITVIAFNNAMDPSEAVCSSGIIIDKTPPEISNVRISTATTQPSIACSNGSIWMISYQYVATPLHRVNECHRHCHQDVDMTLIFKDVKTNNNGSIIFPPKTKSQEMCNILPSFQLHQGLFIASDNLHVSWESKDDESQIYDFYAGISSSAENTMQPDMIDYKSMHNHTSYKCVHCGLGEGDRFYIQIKAMNKATLESIATVGPVTIDFTPPIYTSGLNLNATSDYLTLTWPATAFFDEEDSNPLITYQWSLGTANNYQELEDWTWLTIPHNFHYENHTFSVEYPMEKIETYDQNQGKAYLFSLKAFNRAGLYLVRHSDGYTMHSSIAPSAGKVYHVSPGNMLEDIIREIGFQEETDAICIRWVDFYHGNNEMNMSVGLGTIRGKDDVIQYKQVDYKTGGYCFKNLTLECLNKYFVAVTGFNQKGHVSVSSKGLLIASLNDTLKYAKVNDGLGCSNEEVHVVDSNGTLKQNENKEYSICEAIPSVMRYTMAITYEWDGEFAELVIVTNDKKLKRYTWSFNGFEVTEYYLVNLISVNQSISLLSPSSEINMLTLALSPCLLDQGTKSSVKGLTSSWTFRPEIQESVSHVLISVHELQCSSPRHCADSGQVHPTLSAGTSNTVHIEDITLKEGASYQTEVTPCFGETCGKPIRSEGFLVDSEPKMTSQLFCTIKPNYEFTKDNILGETIYEISATWEQFINVRYGIRNSVLEVYDWTLALSPNGVSLMMKWDRLQAPLDGEVNIHTEYPLHMHDRKTVYLVVRSYTDAYAMIQIFQECSIEGAFSPLALPVYDLPLGYEDLDSIKDFLHSNQLGGLAKKLYDDEVDFSNNTRGISAALQGASCSNYQWWLQTDSKINCKSLSTDKECIKKKINSENIIKFSNLLLRHSVRYFVCVHGSGGDCKEFKVCSNGFIIDIRPPVGGSVYVGNNKENSILSDESSVLISWEGFADLEEEIIIPYGSGIMEYFYAIGSYPGNDNIVKFTSVGLTNHILATNLHLVSGHLHYISVRACDQTYQCTTVTSRPIIVDATPPAGGEVSVNQFGEYQDDIIVHWGNFVDHESGIAGYDLAIGSSSVSQDVQSFYPVSGLVSFITGGDTHMEDGKYYYIQIKATNKVGLSTIVSSTPLLHDSTPPVVGYIHLGKKEKENTMFTTDTQHLNFHWGGFADRDSGILFYRVCAGSQAGQCDEWPWQDVGLSTEVSKEKNLETGKEYFISVEACNGVLKCSQLSSAPLVADDSPPMPGIVQIGHGDVHAMYHSSRTSLAMQWLNFHDPQSGIQKYDWCVGTNTSSCDILPERSAHQSHIQFITNIDLPLAIPLFVNVVATNKVGLTVTGSSPQFIVDITAPVCNSVPVFSSAYSLRPGTQYDRSVLSLKWKFSDPDSPVWSHSVSLHTHHNGHVPVDRILVGDVDDLTISLALKEHLKDGNSYFAVVTACNAGGLCTQALSEDVLIDSSPPHLGGFVEPMMWTNKDQGSELVISWEGFDDAHSGVALYHIMISSTYNGYDLSEQVLTFQHNTAQSRQQQNITLRNPIPTYEMIYLSIWAENGAGLLSDAAKVGVFTLPAGPDHGRLDIEKHSCDIHYCNLDCSCAVVNKVCSQGSSSVSNCSESTSDHSPIIVQDGDPSQIVSISPSSTCLKAFWINTDPDTIPMRYEWSVGGKGSVPGAPIFDILSKKYWFDIELYNKSLYCMQRNESLVHGLEYVYYVKVWYSFENYTVLTSPGVLTDTTPPRVGMGRAVKFMDANFDYEISYSTSLNNINLHWKNVFSDPESGIDHYSVSLGTSQGGNELRGPLNVGLSTNISWSDVSLIPGFRYHASVHAYNSLGIFTSFTSKSLTVDTDPPIPGVVYTSLTFKDISHQHSKLSISWQGFEDLHSFIKLYEWAIGTENQNESTLTFTSSKFETSIELDIDKMGLDDNVSYVLFVRAVDAAGHVSAAVRSNSVLLDHTPPQGYTCDVFGPMEGDWTLNCNVSADNPGHVVCIPQDGFQALEGMLYKVLLHSNTDPLSTKARLQLQQYSDWVNYRRQSPDLFIHESTFFAAEDEVISPTLFVFNNVTVVPHLEIHQCVQLKQNNDPIAVHQGGPVSLHLRWSVNDAQSGMKSYQVGLGTNAGGFQLHSLLDIGQSSSVTLPVHLLQHAMKVHAVVIAENRAGLRSVFRAEPIVVDWTAPYISDVSIMIEAEVDGKFKVSSTWKTEDDESTIQDCEWQLGLSPGSDDLLSPQPTVNLTSASVTGLPLNHGDTVHATIACTNSLALTRQVTSVGHMVVSESPLASSAYVTVHPQQTDVYPPTDSTQARADVLQFEFHGFEDVTGIQAYEYLLGGSSQWRQCPITDHMIIEGLSLSNPQQVSVRAVNSAGLTSDVQSSVVNIEAGLPTLTEKAATYSLTGSTMRLSWSGVFSWSDSPLTYLVYVGSQTGSANLLKGEKTLQTSVGVTSSLWVSPGECFLAVTAVTPGGQHTTYTTTIMY